MAILQNILYKVRSTGLHGSTSVQVKGLCIDSRQVAQGDVFIAIRGLQTDGHQFIEQAIEQGAVAVICEIMPEWFYEHVTYVKVDDAALASGVMAANFYQSPAEKLQLIGVTGTNGKTTVATLLFKLFRALGYSCGLLSTVQNQINDEVLTATHTTPDSIHLQALLARMVAAGCTHAFMEVSSHAIAQHRIAGVHFTGGIFTNITHDHLDYHKTFDAYIKVKKAFFDNLPKTAFALTNLDDKRGSVMLQNTEARKRSYGLRLLADYSGKILENTLSGLMMSIGHQEVHFRMPGMFNAYNLLAVYGTAVELGVDKTEALEKLSGLTGAEGRFELLLSPRTHVIGIVDYAHTPDALLNVLATIQALRKDKERLFTVVGCGGDRDRSKRPEMAQVAVHYSDQVIFTSDNPRSEEPEAIIAEMETGVAVADQSRVLSITDRREAIKTACKLSAAGDIILVAGKGHEKYQEIKGVRNPFDDKVVLAEMFKILNK